MNTLPKSSTKPKRPSLTVKVAETEEEVRATQKLRYRIFAEELGAQLKSADKGIDEDQFDPHCLHLMVTDTDTGKLAGCTRLLTDEGARQAGSFYSASEFNLDPVIQLEGRRLEVGRTCIDPDHRRGAAIAVLWSGLASVVNAYNIDFLFGCASIELDDGGHRAAAILKRLNQQARHEHLDVAPITPVPEVLEPNDQVSAPLPPLLKAYVRLGGKICGEPCWDPDFNVADVLLLLDMKNMDPTYSRHFIERANTGVPKGMRI